MCPRRPQCVPPTGMGNNTLSRVWNQKPHIQGSQGCTLPRLREGPGLTAVAHHSLPPPALASPLCVWVQMPPSHPGISHTGWTSAPLNQGDPTSTNCIRKPLFPNEPLSVLLGAPALWGHCLAWQTKEEAGGWGEGGGVERGGGVVRASSSLRTQPTCSTTSFTRAASSLRSGPGTQNAG